MIEPYEPTPEAWTLFDAACSGSITDEQVRQLQIVLQADPRACDLYLGYFHMHAELSRMSRLARCRANILESVRRSRTSPASDAVRSGDTLPQLAHMAPMVPGENCGLFGGATPHFSHGWPLAYLIATVIFGVGLAIGALVHVSQPGQYARPLESGPARNPQSPVPNPSAVVARISGMADCVWEEAGGRGQGARGSNQKSEIENQRTAVHLGDRIVLKSGLLEIAYDTGAKVILQGPVTYEVESSAGGYLAAGKLTARLEEKSEIRGQRSEVRDSRRLEAANQKSFAVRTPTATITDLGTEFGVEVASNGTTQTRVFRGSIRVQSLRPNGKHASETVLRENEAVIVEVGGGVGVAVPVPADKQAGFVRQIPKRTVKTFDLVDVVAGGDGFSSRRDRGIDPTSGRVVAELSHPPEDSDPMYGDGRYHRIAGMPFVDGVFIPHGGNEPVQVDSAGHRFADFHIRDNATWQHIWAGGEMREPPYPSKVGGIDFAVKPHGLLLLHANAAITFDLDAIRQAHPRYRVSRFRAVAANVEQFSQEGGAVLADLWVLVDGQVRFQRWQVSGLNGTATASVSLGNTDRFLTLAATDSGNGISGDFGFFGDPRLDLLPITIHHE